MMKKHNTEGFALAYVVIVIFILCALSIALMSMTLRTLQAQEASVKRMQDKYAAQGEIERLVAELEATCEGYSKENFPSHAEASDAAASGFIQCINEFTFPANWECELLEYADTGSFVFKNDNDEYVFCVKTKDTATNVSATILLNFAPEQFSYTTEESGTRPNPNYEEELANWNVDSGLPAPSDTLPAYKYTITDVTFNFISYEITSEGGDT